MCGICGKVSLNSSIDISKDLISNMCALLKHRGPDDEGVYLNHKPRGPGSNAKVGLGHRRLSIIDLSSAGHQPMSNENGSVWIVMNGEIYNFLELRELLKQKGHEFKSQTDAEVILHLYEDKGVECLKDLRGMFAFAIWDESSESLFLARDRIGKKPLFYSLRNTDLVFASELNALLQDKGISRDIDLSSIDDFLNYQYIPAPFTIFKEVKKLPPAHFLIWEKGKVRIDRYWNLDYSEKLNLREEEYCERILSLLKEATKIRLISDVPLGAFLSGGIDSSAVVGIMAQLMDRPVKTFSIGFENKSFNETPYAKLVSERFGTEHKEFIVKPNALEILPKLILHFGEPYGDSSAIPTYYLSKITRENVTVALNGDGGDESFGGYERYVANLMAERYRGPAIIANKLFGKIVEKAPESTHKKDKINRLKKFLSITNLNKESRYSEFMAIFNENKRAGIYSDYLKGEIGKNGRGRIISKEYQKSGVEDLIDSTLYVDLMTYMPGDLLPKVDITSMANSLEARSPFLDHKFLEFSAQIPSHLKIRGIVTKYILKETFKKTLPASVLNREKMGFGVPVGEWFRGELKSYAYEVLLDSKAIKRNYFKRESVKQLLDEHCKGKVNNGAKIWSLLNLELWHRLFIDRDMP
ncbi:MAG: asparagine synthase (glutamine-hydrolyzing) [Candidatus Omnitrophica bacterium]|nr:asparagine synthase (glutamine-hydrolyzing) [Candidatus Omnitrophota bacterium]